MEAKEKKNLPSVSIIVPVYNAEPFLEECISSLLEIAYPTEKLECLFIDNNSQDRSPIILEKYSDRVNVLKEKTQGASAARNKGIRAAKNDVVAFIDADCLAHKDWLRNLIEPLNSGKEPIAVGGRILSIRPCNEIEKYGEKIHDHNQAINVFQPPYIITMNMAIRRSLLEEAGLFDEKFLRGEDCELSYRLHQMGCTFAYCHKAIVFHRNEKTLAGLFREGFLHGLWNVGLIKKHQNTLFRFRNRFHLNAYQHLVQSLFLSFKVSFSKEHDISPLCDTVFNMGKKVGTLFGSIRFRFLTL